MAMAIKPDKVSKLLFQFNSESSKDEDEHPGTADGTDVEDELQVHYHTDYDFFRSDSNDDDDDDDHGSRSGDVYDSMQYESEQYEDNVTLQQESATDRSVSLDDVDVSDSHLNESVADSSITSSSTTLQIPPVDQNTSPTFANPGTVPEQYDTLMREVQKSNELIKGLYDRLKKTEDKVKNIEPTVSSQKGKHPAQKTPIPDDVKVSCILITEIAVHKSTLRG